MFLLSLLVLMGVLWLEHISSKLFDE